MPFCDVFTSKVRKARSGLCGWVRMSCGWVRTSTGWLIDFHIVRKTGNWVRLILTDWGSVEWNDGFGDQWRSMVVGVWEGRSFWGAKCLRRCSICIILQKKNGKLSEIIDGLGIRRMKWRIGDQRRSAVVGVWEGRSGWGRAKCIGEGDGRRLLILITHSRWCVFLTQRWSYLLRISSPLLPSL